MDSDSENQGGKVLYRRSHTRGDPVKAILNIVEKNGLPYDKAFNIVWKSGQFKASLCTRSFISELCQLLSIYSCVYSCASQ